MTEMEVRETEKEARGMTEGIDVRGVTQLIMREGIDLTLGAHHHNLTEDLANQKRAGMTGMMTGRKMRGSGGIYCMPRNWVSEL